MVTLEGYLHVVFLAKMCAMDVGELKPFLLSLL